MKLAGYLLLIALSASAARADSLWTPGSKGLFADSKARKAGDVVTVLIVESSSSTQKASTDFSKSLEHENDAGLGPLLKLLPEFAVSSEQKSSAKGNTSRTSNFIAKLTAKITRVLENGNFLLEATRTVETNGEKQDIQLTGTIRPEDIASDNTVLSTYLADAQIKCTGKGPIGDRQKEGIISRLIKFLF